MDDAVSAFDNGSSLRNGVADCDEVLHRVRPRNSELETQAASGRRQRDKDLQLRVPYESRGEYLPLTGVRSGGFDTQPCCMPICPERSEEMISGRCGIQ